MDSERPVRKDAATKTTADSTNFFYVGVALFLMLTAVVGFWPSYFGPLLRGDQMTMRLPTRIQPWVIHLHALLFMGWLSVLLVQSILIARRKTWAHTKLGRYGVALGTLVVAVALFVVALRTSILVSETEIPLSAAPAINLGIVLQPILFAVLLGLGYRARSRPDAHKRYMLFATFSIMPAATDRMFYILGPWSMQIMFVAFIATVIAHDYRTRNRVHYASLIGMGLLLINVLAFSLPFTHGG